ncbi:MAG: glycosyl hydrolase family 18 protein [Gemmatimonadaceae bacterium]
MVNPLVQHMRLLLSIVVALPVAAAAQASEAIWYVRNSEAGIASFAANAPRISAVAPQVYSMDSTGAIRGGMDPRTTAARSLAALCRSERVHGIQLDFENLHVSDRDAFTALAREAADSVHRAGCELSAAVVPRTDDDRGPLPYHQYMYDYWRGAYDFKALADTLDFISYMTYAQHTGGSTPGPVAGYEWMVASLNYVLAAGVPPSKISLGLPSYSDYWTTSYDPATGSRPRARDIAYPELMRIIADAGAKPRWDKRQKSWVAMWEDHGVFEHAWIEDARAFKAKLALVQQHGFRGYSVWLLGTEDPKVWDVVGQVRR